MVTVTEAFSGARDGDRLRLCPGRSLHGAPLVLSKVNDVVISGDKTSLVASGDFPVVQLSKSSKVVLEGVHVVHEVGEWCAHGCVEIYDSSQMTVRNSELDGSGYFGIITSKVTDSEFRDNLFHNCHYGFSAWSSQGLTLIGNTFRDNRGANLETADGSSYANDVQVDNTFGAVKPATAPPKSAP
jgi:parallel beta-helix repeat protein